MKKYYRLLTWLSLLIFLFAMGSTVLASNVSTADFSGIIQITNTSTAATNVATTFTLSSADMISQGWFSSNFTGVGIRNSSGGDVPFGPAVTGAYPWCIWVPSINANSIEDYTLYTGPSDMGFTKYYFPGAGGMTVPDNPLIEPSDNFTYEIKGYVDTTATGANKYLIDKTAGMTDNGTALFVSPTVSGNITGQIITTVYGEIDNLIPNAAGDTTNIDLANPAVAHYLNVDDPVGAPDDAATYVATANSGWKDDTYNLTSSTIPATAISTSNVTVTVHYRGLYVGGTGAVMRSVLRLGGVEIWGAQNSATLAWADYSDNITRPGGGSWAIADFASLQAGIRIASSDGVSEVRITQVYATITYDYSNVAAEVSATGVTSEEHTITLTTEKR